MLLCYSNVPPAAAQLTLAPAGVLVSVIVSTTFCVLVVRTVVTGFHFVKAMVFRGAVTVLTVTDKPEETVMVGMVVVVERTVEVPVIVVSGAVDVMVELRRDLCQLTMRRPKSSSLV